VNLQNNIKPNFKVKFISLACFAKGVASAHTVVSIPDVFLAISLSYLIFCFDLQGFVLDGGSL
jgi:hypothetical protein